MSNCQFLRSSYTAKGSANEANQQQIILTFRSFYRILSFLGLKAASLLNLDLFLPFFVFSDVETGFSEPNISANVKEVQGVSFLPGTSSAADASELSEQLSRGEDSGSDLTPLR
ncbi:hypothetical protein E4U24_007052 [Claviceps purpurea]|nr:hypothetical protein E4U24_007052 [Claviceps purpurea]